ncbi:PadR family transcriptional regulator [Asticcacaulis taihuensis]|uniref:PadR family transcriptional regulator n=1 Tax=Asticcacaulis taihuensis TaxID=260084 RepID=UPI0034E98A19
MSLLNDETFLQERSRPKADVLQRFEFAVLSCVKVLSDDAFPAEIARRLSQSLDRPVSIAQVFKALERLEDKELVTSHDEPPRPVIGGRRRRVFTLLESGTQALAKTTAAFRTPL